MEFRNLYSFLRVAELGSFSKAAEEMGYAQATISTQIQRLEEELGVSLFERIGKRNTLTIHGHKLLAYANGILRLQEEALSLGKESEADLTGSLRIGIVESIMSSVLLSVIGAYRQRYPKVSIFIQQAVTAPLLEHLRHNDVDLIFTMGERVWARDCILVRSHPEHAVFVASPRHPLAQQSELELKQVLDQHMIFLGDHVYLQQELYKIASSCSKTLTSYIQTDSSRTVLELVHQNLGIAFVPEYIVRPACLDQDLVVLPVKDFSMQFDTHIFYHKNKWVTPQMMGLIRLVEQYWNKQEEERGS